MSAAGTLLQCRNDQMVAHGTITGLQLKSGGASKQTHKRLHSRSMSVSYTTVINKQEMLAIGFDAPVLEWKKEMEDHADKLSELKSAKAPLEEMIQKDEHNFTDFLQLKDINERITKLNIEAHPGFQLVGDNIDFTTNPRQFTSESGRKSLHYFNFFAVKNRVSHFPVTVVLFNVENERRKEFEKKGENKQSNYLNEN